MSDTPAKSGGIFRSFSHRDYRLFYSGQIVSLTGNWIQSTVQGWLVYSLTLSSAALGAVGFAAMAPTLLLGVFAGVYADRWDKRRALLGTQALSMLQASVLAALTISGHVQVWHIAVLACFAGCVGAFDMPIRQSFVVELVGRRDLSNALALNSMMFNMARIAGPAAAGLLIGIMGPGWCFALNAATYTFVIAALWKISGKRAAGQEAERREPVMESLKAGLRYAWNHHHIRNPLILLACVSTVVMPFMTLMPVAAVELLGGGPGTLGLLLSCVGAGAFAGGLHLAGRGSPRRMGSLIGSASVFYGASVIAFSFSRVPAASFLLLVAAGAGMMRQSVGCNTLIQSLVADSMRGRVMSLYVLTFVGLAPLGSLFLGWLAEHIGIAGALRLAGLWVLLSAAWFISRLWQMKESVRRLSSDPASAGRAEWLGELI
ncbi:MAG: MFS transporter [Elusimicrobiales bacterium]|jgi:MFS family permease|nr:MFS transporter [Elusimicrobiales bacterium]